MIYCFSYIAIKAFIFFLNHSVFANHGSSVLSLPNEKYATPKKCGLIEVGRENMEG
jgi:hypothetical protein